MRRRFLFQRGSSLGSLKSAVVLTTWILLTQVTFGAARPQASADASLYFPKAGIGGERLGSFLETAGRYSPLLDPQGFKQEAHPLFLLDLTTPRSLEPFGIDPEGPYTLSAVGEGRVTCTRLRNPKRYEQRAGERLSVAGKPWNAEFRGSVLKGAQEAGQVVEGYALRAREACAAVHPSDTERLLKDAAVSLNAAAGASDRRLNALPGVAYLFVGKALFGLDATPTQLSVEGALPENWLPPLAPSAVVPYGPPGALTEVPGEGLLFARGQVASAGISRWVQAIESELKKSCKGCLDSTTDDAIKALSSALTGKVALRLSGLSLSGPLPKGGSRLFLFKGAAVAEVSDGAKVSALLDGVAQRDHRGDFIKGGTGWRLQLGGERALQLALQGNHLLVGNDEPSLQKMKQVIASAPALLHHGAEVVMDAPALAASLGRVSLLDVLGSAELAAAVAAGAELRPLLKATQKLAATLDTQQSLGAGGGPGTRLSGKWAISSRP